MLIYTECEREKQREREGGVRGKKGHDKVK